MFVVFQFDVRQFSNSRMAKGPNGNQIWSIETIPQTGLTNCCPFRSTEYKKVPIATVSGTGIDKEAQHLFGSDVIIDHMLQNGEEKLKETIWKDSGLSAETFQSSPSAEEWKTWAQEELAAILYPNLASSFFQSYQAFQYVHSVPHWSYVERLTTQGVGALAMTFAAGRVKSEWMAVAIEKELLWPTLFPDSISL